MSRGDSVGILTGYGLDDRGSAFRFLAVAGNAWRYTSTPIQLHGVVFSLAQGQFYLTLPLPFTTNK